MNEAAAITDRRLEILFSAAEIEAQVHRLADEVAAAMGEDVLLAAILKGSFVFAADLIRALHHTGMRPQIDFMTQRQEVPADLTHRQQDEPPRRHKVLFRRQAGPARVTIFKGGHEIDVKTAFDWMATRSRQPKS